MLLFCHWKTDDTTDYSGGYNKPGSDEYTTGSGRNNTVYRMGWDGMGLCVTWIVDPIVTPVSRYQCCNNSIVVRSFFFLGEDGGTIYIYPRTSRPW